MSKGLYTIKTGDNIVVSNGLKTVSFSVDFPEFPEAVRLINEEDFDGLSALVNKANEVSSIFGGSGYEIDGVAITEYVYNKILELKSLGIGYEPILNFMKNLSKNPNKKAASHLFQFLEKGNMPITPDGYFLAYKKVRGDYKDIYTGTMDNSVGAVVDMDRAECDEDENNTCSKGLHFCSKEYLSIYGELVCDAKVVVVKVNPKDVVSIPPDYNQTKGRACYYVVVDDITDEYVESGIEDSFSFRVEHDIDLEDCDCCNEDCDSCNENCESESCDNEQNCNECLSDFDYEAHIRDFIKERVKIKEHEEFYSNVLYILYSQEYSEATFEEVKAELFFFMDDYDVPFILNAIKLIVKYGLVKDDYYSYYLSVLSEYIDNLE
jgi:hypothetical protein